MNRWISRRECNVLMPVMPGIVLRLLWMPGARFCRQEMLVKLCLMRAHVWVERLQRLMRARVVAQVRCLPLRERERLLQRHKRMLH